MQGRCSTVCTATVNVCHAYVRRLLIVCSGSVRLRSQLKKAKTKAKAKADDAAAGDKGGADASEEKTPAHKVKKTRSNKKKNLVEPLAMGMPDEDDAAQAGDFFAAYGAGSQTGQSHYSTFALFLQPDLIAHLIFCC
jgi:hypothetical protein